jgi:hypothetical protein
MYTILRMLLEVDPQKAIMELAERMQFAALEG